MPEQSLSKEQWALVRGLFGELLDSENPAEVAARVSEPEIRKAVEELWRQHLEAEGRQFLERQLTVVKRISGEIQPPVFQAGQLLAGRFAVLRGLGSGGMGEVYLAEDRVLMETVAVKTIKRDLAVDGEHLERFRDEVRRSRQVTHPNVCRIFDISEHEGMPFYWMEYLAGPTLAEVLTAGLVKHERARDIAVQVAEGLAAAHQKGVLHCDFKPANIILTGSGRSERAVVTDFGLALALSVGQGNQEDRGIRGTPDYMAPELLTGGQPTIQSDIFAFGRVLDELLPNNALAKRCMEAEPDGRPASMEEVLAGLRGTGTRRAVILGGLFAAAGATGILYLRERWQPKIPLGSRQRLRVNGFAPSEDQDAKAVRTLLMMALRQSPLLSVVGDRFYRPKEAGRVVSAGFSLPLADLLTTAREEKSNLALDGRMERVGTGLKLTLAVFDPTGGTEKYGTAVSLEGSRSLVRLAELAAAKLRAEAFGEAAFHSSYRPIEKITSSSPAAIDLYFRAVYQYEQADALATLDLLNQALALDPNFVIAEHFKALTLGAYGLSESAEICSEKAFGMRERVAERERNWIEWLHYSVVGAWAESAEALRRNTVLFPDEAVFERQLAFPLARLGRYEEAIRHNRRAVELDPFGRNNTDELLLNLAEAGQVQEFFKLEGELASRGLAREHYSAGMAYLQQMDYPKALKEFEELGVASLQQKPWSRLSMAVPLIMAGRFMESMELLRGDIALDSSRAPSEREEWRLFMRRHWLGELYRLKDRPNESAEQAEFLVNLRPLGCNLVNLREGTLLALDLKQVKLAELGLDKLAAIASKWPSAHTEASVWMTRALLGELEGDAASSEGLFSKAKGTWPDPLNLFYLARSEGRAGLFELQLGSLRELDRQRGKLFRFHFAGMAVLGWLEQARCLEKLARFDESLRLYERVMNHWGNPQAGGRLMQDALRGMDSLKRRLA